MAGGKSNGTTSVCIDELASLMTEKINYYNSVADIPKSRMSSCFIPKIQKNIRMLDRAAYEPSIMPIGPYHHGNPCLQTFQKKKWSCLRYILSMNRNVQLHDYLNKISEIETRARNCYADEMEMCTSEFLQMLLIDGCFILVHLQGINGMDMCNSGIRVLDYPERIDLNTIQLDREHLNKARSSEEIIEEYGMEHANTTIGQSQHIGTSSKGKDRVQSFLPVDSVPMLEPGKISQERNGDKCSADYQDAKWYANYAYHDILLLENQIPFFAVKTIYEVLAGTQDSNTLIDNIAKFIESILYVYPIATQEADKPKNFHHLLHLCHIYLSPNQQREQEDSMNRPEFFQGLLCFGRRYFRVGQLQDKTRQHSQNTLNNHHKLIRWKRATQYHEAGIEFKRREHKENRRHSLLDIRFHNGLLEVPFLFIDDITNSFFRNLIALEQTSLQIGNDFTAYAAFISQLISSPKDVSLLAKRGIIVHQMRSDEDVSVIFTRLLKNVDFDRNSLHYLRNTCIALEEHYQNRLNRWMAWLWQNHFSNPWLSLAVLAAIIVLVCTILQLLFAMLAYVNPVADTSSQNFGNTNP